jgi:hypothetical protein
VATGQAVLVVLIGSHRPAGAYTGGPVSVEVAGYAPVDKRIYFRLVTQDESWSPPRAYYFDLDGDRPAQAIRARSLENPDSFEMEWNPPSWQALRRRLMPMGNDAGFVLVTEVRAESTGVDRWQKVPAFRLHIDLGTEDLHARPVLTAYCNMIVGVKGLYRVPERRERLVILTVTGRAYGCEEVETPILLK